MNMEHMKSAEGRAKIEEEIDTLDFIHVEGMIKENEKEALDLATKLANGPHLETEEFERLTEELFVNRTQFSKLTKRRNALLAFITGIASH